jgi:hypothetical protein
VIVAIAAATIALWSAKIQRDALQLDQRPYLKVSFSRVKPNNDNHGVPYGYDAWVEVEVSGKTPAFNVHADGSCIAPEFLDEHSHSIDKTNGLASRLWPFLFNDKQTIICDYYTGGVPLRNSDLPLTIPFNLTVQYDDIFKNHHTTAFCVIISTEGTPRDRASGASECEKFQFIMN